MEGLRLWAWVFRWTCPGKLRACRSFGFRWACPGLLRACNKKSILNIHCENGVNTDCLPTPDILPLLCSLLPVFCNYLSFYHLTIIVSTWQYCVALKLLLDVLSLNLPSCELKKILYLFKLLPYLFLFLLLNLLLPMMGFSSSGLSGARASGGLTGGMLKINLEVITN